MARNPRKRIRYTTPPEHLGSLNPLDGLTVREDAALPAGVAWAVPSPIPAVGRDASPRRPQAVSTPLTPIYRDDARGIWLYHGNCLSILDAIATKHPDGRFDMIFADPPYFLSNGGITCHAGKMVKVDKGEWDRSKGPELNHEFNTEWLRRCQRVLRPNGTIWVTGTHHVIFSVGYAMQQLGYKILNDIAWEKPNPPPNLSCRYFTHSTETVLWAAKNDQSKHVFNYKAMRAVTGKQMKTVWAILPPSNGEKTFGKHPTQKPVALIERCIAASTNDDALVLDPFMGGGTTAVVCARLHRLFIGIELDFAHLQLAAKRADRELIEIWLRDFRVRVDVSVTVCDLSVFVGRAGWPSPPAGVAWEAESDETPLSSTAIPSAASPLKNDPNDLDPQPRSMDRINEMADVPEIQTESIFHETKLVFLSCAQARTGSVVHTTVDADVQSAWTHTPQSVKLRTTHIVRCETEILRVK